MVPAETSPAQIFSKLFLQGTVDEIKRETQRLSDGGSVLDLLQEETKRLKKTVSVTDRHKLDAYFGAVRDAETELAEVQAWNAQPKPKVNRDVPVDVVSNADIIGRLELLFGLIPLILETDSSRVISLMIQDHSVVPQIRGINIDQHNLSHHGQDEVKINQLKIVEAEIVRRFGKLLADLQQSDLGHGSLLDETAVLFGSNLGNASSHVSKQLPILLAGGGFSHGKHIAAGGEEDAPLSDLFVTLLQRMGVEVDAFGQGASALHWS